MSDWLQRDTDCLCHVAEVEKERLKGRQSNGNSGPGGCGLRCGEEGWLSLNRTLAGDKKRGS